MAITTLIQGNISRDLSGILLFRPVESDSKVAGVGECREGSEIRRRLEAQRDFAEPFLPDDVGCDEVLEQVDGLADWATLEALCGNIYAAPVGRPSNPLRVLIRDRRVPAW